eukprot:746830-Hanusia_phi.AAC.4
MVTGQDRTGQDRTGRDGTGRDRTGQDRTYKQDRTEQANMNSPAKQRKLLLCLQTRFPPSRPQAFPSLAEFSSPPHRWAARSASVNTGSTFTFQPSKHLNNIRITFSTLFNNEIAVFAVAAMAEVPSLIVSFCALSMGVKTTSSPDDLSSTPPSFPSPSAAMRLSSSSSERVEEISSSSSSSSFESDIPLTEGTESLDMKSAA